MKHVLIATLLSASLAAAGCDKKDPANAQNAPEKPSEPAGAADEPAPSTPAAAPDEEPAGEAPADAPADAPDEPAAAEPTAAAPARSAGAAEPGNDPKLVELALAAKGCKLDARYPKNACRDEVKALREAFDPAKHLDTLFNLLDDETPQVRFVALRVIDAGSLMQQKEPRAYASRLIAVAERETEPAMGALFADPLMQGPFDDQAYADGVKRLAASHATPELRASAVSRLFVATDGAAMPFLAERYGAEKDASVRESLIGSLYLAGGKDAEVCGLLVEALDDAERKVVTVAAYNLVAGRADCSAHADAFLASYEARAKAGDVDFNYVLKTDFLYKSKWATDEHKQRFANAGKAIVENASVSGMVRAKVLEGVHAHAPDGEAFTKGVASDPDATLSKKAKELLAGK